MYMYRHRIYAIASLYNTHVQCTVQSPQNPMFGVNSNVPCHKGKIFTKELQENDHLFLVPYMVSASSLGTTYG